MKLDHQQEKQLCAAILGRLEKDTNNDVQAVSVKCLSVLVRRVAEPQVVEICTRLCQHILSGRAEMRDVYGIGMKTLIAEALPAHAHAIAEHACRALLSGVESPEAGVRGRARLGGLGGGRVPQTGPVEPLWRPLPVTDALPVPEGARSPRPPFLPAHPPHRTRAPRRRSAPSAWTSWVTS